MKKQITTSVRETHQLAKKFANSLKSGQIITLTGDLGGGKTTFIQGLAKALGVKKRITSPTFVLMKVYPAKNNNINKICHIDAYRMKSPSDLLAIGAEEYIKDKNCLTLIEWGEKVKSILPKHKKITLKVINDHTREIKIY